MSKAAPIALLCIAGGLIPACKRAEACCPGSTNYVAKVEVLGDSIAYGVAAQTLAGWREPLYFTAQTPGKKFYFVGSQQFAGNSSGLAVDPYCEAYPGITIANLNALHTANVATFTADLAIADAGTNDIGVDGTDAPTTVARMSTWLDTIWSYRKWPWFQIVVFTLLKRLDVDDPIVQATNALLPAMIAGKSYASHITLVDQYAAIPNPTIGVNMNDAVHPNDSGYTSIAAAIWAGGFQTALKAARGP